MLRNDSGKPGTPLSLTTVLGIGVLNSRHKATGERFPEAIDAMTTLNAKAAAAALQAGVKCATDITGFGLLGHLHKLARASRHRAVSERGTRGVGSRLRQRRHPAQPRLGGASPDLSAVSEEEALLLADAQTSGGLLVAGEIPGAPIIGGLVARGDHTVVVR